MSQKTFILYQSYRSHVELLTDDQAGKLFKAIFSYNSGSGQEIKLEPILALAFSFIKSDLDRNKTKYNNLLERNRTNGIKGGRPQNPKNPNDKDKKKEKDIMVMEKERKFQKPTLEEIQNYCLERKNNVNPQKWLNHYESNGWRVGKNQMKNWKAAIRTWENSEFSPPNKTTQNHTLCDQINQIIGADNLIKIESQGTKALLYVASESVHKQLIALPEKTRDKIKEKIKSQLKTTEFEIKF